MSPSDRMSSTAKWLHVFRQLILGLTVFTLVNATICNAEQVDQSSKRPTPVYHTEDGNNHGTGDDQTAQTTNVSSWKRIALLTTTAVSTFSTAAASSSTSSCWFLVGFLPTLSANKGQNKHFVGAFEYALKRINDRLANETGTGCRIRYETVDNKADMGESLRGMTSLYIKGAVAFIGPEDTCATEAILASAWNLPMIAFKCRDSVQKMPEGHYSTFARTMPSTSKVSKSLIALMTSFGWARFQAIVGRSAHGQWKHTAETLAQLATQNGIEVNNHEFFDEPYIRDTNLMPAIIEKTYKNTRVYVFLGDQHALIDFVRAMAYLGINGDGEYVVIAVQDDTFDPKKKEKYFKKFFEDLEERMVSAFDSVLMLLPRPPSNSLYDQFLSESREYSYRTFNAPTPPHNYSGMKIPVSGLYASYLHDAVSVYARALQEVLIENVTSVRNGTAILNKIKGRMYESIQGHVIYIDEDGDAEANYTVVALISDDEGEYPTDDMYARSLQPIGHFEKHGDDIPYFVYDREIEWVGGQAPRSEPECGFDGSRCRFDFDWPIAVACIVSASVVVTAVTFACRHYLYEQKLARMLWKIDYKDLLMTDLEHEPTLSDRQKRQFGRLSYLSSSGEGSKDDVLHLSRGAFTKIASYKGSLVAVKMLKKRHVEVTRAVKKELYLMKELVNDNINRFIGACIDPGHLCIVTHYCSRGSLKDILENPDLHLDDMFIASLVSDLVKGMICLHESEIVSHGNLRSSNCLVDSRWVLQIADYGLHSLRSSDAVPSTVDENAFYQSLLWRAPELLRDRCSPSRGTQKGDVYSFSIILVEIHGRSGPWGQTILSPREIVERVKSPVDGWLYRPETSQLKCPDFMIRCIQECWNEEPDQRPDFKYIRVLLKPMQEGLSSNIFDNMLAIMAKYANTLETLVDERTVQLAQEKKTTESLLLRMLPKSVAEQLIGGEAVIPEHYECVTIYFSDIVSFTTLSAESTPMEVVDMLNDLYTLFDSIIEGYDVYKVETIGDAYMVVSGLPIRNDDNHAGEIASMSLHLLRAIKDFHIRHRPSETLMLRIGIHSGPVVAGVVGLKMPRYCLFGDTVNTASRMESTGEPLKIHCSRQTKQLLEKLGGYNLVERGLVYIKGKGEVFTYFLAGEDCVQRIRRMSVEKPELFPSSTTSGLECLNDSGLTPLASQDNESVCSSTVVMLQDDFSLLPTVRITDTDAGGVQTAACPAGAPPPTSTLALPPTPTSPGATVGVGTAASGGGSPSLLSFASIISDNGQHGVK